MKVLLDECLPHDFRHSFATYAVHTVQWAGFSGKQNGELLRAAETAGYDVLLTVDQGLLHQRSSGRGKLAIILVHSRTNQMEDLLPLADAILRALETIRPGEVVAISESR